MLLPVTAVASVLTLLPLAATAGFDPKTDSCMPRSTAFAASTGKTSCQQYFVDSDFAVYDCDKARRFSYDIKQNQVRMIVSNPQQDGEFTVHVDCMVKGKSVGAYELRTPVTRDENFNRVFQGFTRPCNLASAETSIKVSSYTLTRQALGQCTQRPVKH